MCAIVYVCIEWFIFLSCPLFANRMLIQHTGSMQHFTETALHWGEKKLFNEHIVTIEHLKMKDNLYTYYILDRLYVLIEAGDTCVCYFFEMKGTKRQAEKKTQDTTHVKGYFISTINRISIHIICCFCRRRRIEVFGRSIESVQSSCKRYFHSWTEAKVSLDCNSMLV